MRVARIFMGVGRLLPLVSLQFEMNTIPVKWEAMKSLEYWIHVMRLGEGRIVKEIEGGYESGKQNNVGERPDDRLGEVWTQKL